MRTARVLPLLVFLLLPLPLREAGASGSWAVRIAGGAPWNVPLPLTIRQDGEAGVRTTGRFSTRPFESPWYYSVRIGRWADEKAWEAELVHSKLYLDRPPAEVQSFSLSHGFNLLTLNRAARHRGLVVRGGIGFVITHPESTVRGRRFDESGGLGGGYRLSGGTAQGSVEKRFRVLRWLAVSVEGKVTASYARVPVAGGHADVPNVALHALLGLEAGP